MVILPCLGPSQLLWHQAGSREVPWAGWGVGCCPPTAQLHQHLALTALFSPLLQGPAEQCCWHWSPSDGRMVVLRQFRLLLWKNYILQVGWQCAWGPASDTTKWGYIRACPASGSTRNPPPYTQGISQKKTGLFVHVVYLCWAV